MTVDKSASVETVGGWEAVVEGDAPGSPTDGSLGRHLGTWGPPLPTVGIPAAVVPAEWRKGFGSKCKNAKMQKRSSDNTGSNGVFGGTPSP